MDEGIKRDRVPTDRTRETSGSVQFSLRLYGTFGCTVSLGRRLKQSVSPRSLKKQSNFM
jgi:hypothetical protein